VQNSESVQVGNGICQLIANVFRLLLRELEVSLRKVVEKVATLKMIHHYVPIARCLKVVLKGNKVWVLAHL